MTVFQMLDKIDVALRVRIERVASTARECGERGIVVWAVRAAEDAVALGKVRDKDLRTLERLEGTFSDDFYSNRVGGQERAPVYA
jgi:hypothetical protein